MDQNMSFFLLLLTTLFAQPLTMLAQPSQPTSHITVQGSVFCDACHNNTFSRHSYFLPGVEVHIQCKLKANSPRTTEEMDYSVNRTTNRYGFYKLDIPTVEGVDCIKEMDIQAFCEASLKGSSSSHCNIPGLRNRTTKMTLKSKQNNQCIYRMRALSYRPLSRNATVCGNKNMRSLPLPSLPSLPPLPPLPPLPSIPPLPPLPSFPSWPFTPPPPPPFNQARPLLSSPTPPTSNVGGPRTWLPRYPPAPPTNPQQQHP